MEIKPVTLEGQHTRLEPLSEAHVADLCRVGFDPEIWRWMLYGSIDTPQKMRAYVQELLAWQRAGETLPFAVIHLGDGRAIGCTRYLDIRPAHRSLEIGGTWYGPGYQRSAVNTECKYMLLRQAFEVYHCIRVQLKTDSLNLRSMKAIERIGAVREGVLRNHMIRPDGSLRHSVIYSIVDDEWPQVKQRLEAMLAR
jgi:RimJ/RimL family protein N-acetyltransferase